VFGVQPASIGYVGEQYKVTQGDAMDASRRVGLGRLLAVRKEFYDDLCRRLGCPDVEDDPDREEQVARTAVLSCGGPFKTVDEVRAERGLGPLPEGERPHGGDDTPPDEGDEPVERADDDVVGWFTDPRSGKKVPVTEAKAVARLAKRAAAVHNGDPPTEGADPGSTHDARGKNLVGVDAYAVAVHPKLSEVVQGRELSEETVTSYVRRNFAEITRAGAFGTWYSSGSDKTYLDVVTIVRDRDEAIAMGTKHNQIEIVHLKTLEFIDTGGTGE